jgi:hypothetical protein
MNDRALITLGVLLFVAAACTFVALLVPWMRRILWIVLLSLGLLEFAGATIFIAFAGISHRHLNTKGFTMLLVNSVASWIIFRLLSSEIRKSKGDERTDAIDRFTDSR